MVYKSKHFAIQPLAEGIFAAIAEDGGSAICNVGLVDLGGQILVFDAFLTPQAAKDLRRFAVDRFGRAPQIAINSHYHNDHIWGNQVFAAGAQIISSTRTRDLIATSGVEEFQWYSANSAKRLESLHVQYQNTQDKREKQDLLLWMGEYGGIVEALPQLTVCMPSITFDNRLEIHGETRTAELITFEGGHTASDTILHLPQDRIVFMGDLLFVRAHPWLGECNPLSLQNALRELRQLNACCYVPGHGPVGACEDLEGLIDYIDHCHATARKLTETGSVTDDAIKALQIPEIYREWKISQFYATNIRFFCERLSSADSGSRPS
jgi:glyoxylase-like metal-dependent hydrolase (beta-lactamase superfamily II)